MNTIYTTGTVDPEALAVLIKERAALRAALAARDAEIERLKTVPMKYRRMTFNAELQEKVEAQRKVLEQALEALNETLYWRRTGVGRPPEQTADDAITAIQGVLK